MSPDPTTLALKQSSDGQKKEGMKDGDKEEEDEDEWTTPMIIMLIVLIVVGVIALLALGLVVVSNSCVVYSASAVKPALYGHS